MVQLRPFRPKDAPALLALFRDTVRRVNARDYTAEQVRAWAPDDIPLNEWSARFAGRFVTVAEDDREVIGFAELERNGHIDRFYVAADRQRCGVGRALLDALVREAIAQDMRRLFTEASITACPFFESQGFVLIAPQVVSLRGIAFRNFRMQRLLGPTESSGPWRAKD